MLDSRSRGNRAWFVAVVLTLMLVVVLIGLQVTYRQPAAPSLKGDVRDFGAKGDGVTDDIRAIQAAIASVSGKGGVVTFPEGTFLISSDIKVSNSSNVTIQGAGAATVIKVKDGSMANGIHISESKLCRVRNLTVDGNKANIDSSGPQYDIANGIRIYKSTDVMVDGTYVHDAYYGGITLDHSTNVSVTGNRVWNTRDNGIYLRPGNSRVIIQDNIVSGATYSGIQALGSDYVDVIGNVTYSNGPAVSTEGDGIGFEGCRFSSIVGNISHSNGTQGIKTDFTTEMGDGQDHRSTDILIANNTIHDQPHRTGTPEIYGSGIELLRTDRVVVQGNYINGSYYGVNVGENSSVTVEGNTVVAGEGIGIRIHDAVAAGPMLIRNNNVSGQQLHGIETFVSSTIMGNNISGNQRAGINLVRGDSHLVTGNVISDNGWPGLRIDQKAGKVMANGNSFIGKADKPKVVEEVAGAGPTTLVGNIVAGSESDAYSLTNSGSRVYGVQSGQTR